MFQPGRNKLCSAKHHISQIRRPGTTLDYGGQHRLRSVHQLPGRDEPCNKKKVRVLQIYGLDFIPHYGGQHRPKITGSVAMWKLIMQ